MVEEIAPETLKKHLDRGDDLHVVDIRSERAFDEGHIPGAENLPFDRLTREIEDHEWGDAVVFVCPMGESSLQAARLLESYEGIDENASVSNMKDGYREWEYELESGTETRVTDN